jgi:hypothetical protein
MGVEYNVTPGLQSGKENLIPVSAKTRAVLTSLTLETVVGTFRARIHTPQ